MPAPKNNRYRLVSTGLLLGLLILGLAFFQAKRGQPVATTIDAAFSPPAPIFEIPALPAPAPVTRTAAAAPASALPQETADWIAQRFPDSQVLEQRELPAAPDGTRQREYLLDTQFKYHAVEVRETWQRAPGAATETLLKREAWVADHFLLKPRPGLDIESLEAAVAQGGGSLDQTTLARNGLLIVRLAQADLGAVKEAVAAFSKANGPAVYAEPDYLVFTSTIPNDPSFAQQTGLDNPPNHNDDIDAVAGWTLRNSAAGVLVAVIDTGVRYTHEDLRGNIWQNSGEIAGNGLDDDGDGVADDVHGVNFYANTGDPSDDEGHGTHVAGILGASGNNGAGIAGVAWRVTILPIKFQDSHGSGTSSDAVRATDFAVSKGAQIISDSWGSYAFSQALHDSVAAASDAGVLCVAAAGNDDNNTDIYPFYPAGFDVDNVISVGALNAYVAADFSNFGPKSVDLYAPGTNIYSLGFASDTAYATLSGTSQATPFVSGALALLKAEFPTKSAAWLKQRLLETARPNSFLLNLALTGGQLDLYNALAHITPPPVAITTQPVSFDADSGDMISAQVNATGGGPLQYQWYKDGVALAGQTAAALSIANPTAADAGQYYVVVRNFGSAVTSDTVTVAVKNSAPRLTLAPASARALVGQRLTLSAAFKGSRPMTFQWELNGSPVNGATGAQLVLDPFTAAQQGAYRLTATNAYGSFTTDPVQVTLVQSYLENWERLAPTPTTADFQHVAWLDGEFVAVGTAGTIARSPDGAQWHVVPPVTTAALNAVAYGNGIYVAVGTGGTILSSTDGEVWVDRTGGPRPDLGDVAFGNGMFIAVDPYHSYHSTDGIRWTERDIVENEYSTSTPTIAFGNGRFVVAGGGNGIAAYAYASADGLAWVKSTPQYLAAKAFVSFADGTFWLSDIDGSWSSSEGLAWTYFRSGEVGRLWPAGDWLYYRDFNSRLARMPKADPQGAREVVCNVDDLPELTALAAGAGGLVAVGRAGTILHSGDGAAFTYASDFSAHWAVGFVDVNGEFLTVDERGAVFTSTDGTAWAHLSDIPKHNWYRIVSIAYGNGVIVVTDDESGSYSSSDGAQWTMHFVGGQGPYPGPHSPAQVRFVGDYFWIPLTFENPAYRSRDGTDWTVVSKAPQAYGGGRYLELENGHKAAVSTDGATWALFNFPGYQGAMCYDGGLFHVVDGQAYLTSPDGVAWTSTPTAGLSGQPSRLLREDGLFLATDDAGICLSTDGIHWLRKVNQPPIGLISAPGIVLASLADTDTPASVLRVLQPRVDPITAPLAVTTGATGVTHRQATLAGAVDCGGADTIISLEWGLTSSFGQTQTLPVVHTIRGAHPVSVFAKNLLAATLYYYRIRATNSEGTALGETLTFTTLPNTPPVAIDDGPIIVSGQTAVAIPVLANDSDAESDPLTIISVTLAAHGTVAITEAGLTYTPASDFPGADQFSYTIADPSGATATATVRLRTNAAPIATPEEYDELIGPGPFVLRVLDNDRDPDGDPLTLSAVSGSGLGTAVISGATIIYTPPAGYSGPDQISYAVTDPFGQTATAHALLHVSLGRPAAPAARLMIASGADLLRKAPEVDLPEYTKMSGFGPPALSDFRQLASTVTLTLERLTFTGILLVEENGSGSVLAATTFEAPGAAPAKFQSFSNPVLSPHGAVAFIAKIKSSGPRGAVAQGVWSTAFTADGSAGLVLKTGTPITGNGLREGTSLVSFTSVDAVDGALYVLGQLSAPGGAVLLRIDSAGPQVLLREKGTLTPGVVIQHLSVLQPALASAGQGRWGGAQGLVAKATLSDRSTALLKIAADGTVSRLLSTWPVAAPGDSFAWSVFGLPALTPDGGAAFTGTLKIGAKPVIGGRGLGATDSKIVEVGQTAADAGLAQYASFYDPVAGQSGVAFLALLKGHGVTPANRTGLWWNDFSHTRKLAQLGDAAPDAAGHLATPATAGPRWQALSSIALPGGAQAGPVVFGKVAGPTVTTSNNTGLWAVDSAGVLRQLLRTGSGALPNEPRSIVSIATLGADAGAFGVGRSYNSTGSLAVKVVFNDGTQALVRLDVP